MMKVLKALKAPKARRTAADDFLELAKVVTIPAPDDDGYVTTGQIMDLFDISRHVLSRLVKNGHLPEPLRLDGKNSQGYYRYKSLVKLFGHYGNPKYRQLRSSSAAIGRRNSCD